MSLRKPVASLAILLLLASSLLVVAPVGATHGGTPKVQILSPDYETAPTCTPTPAGVTGPCIQGLGAFFAVEVQDTDLTAATTTVTARVTSTIDLVGETITLTRHKPASGAGEDTFFGTVGFESSIVAANGRVRVVDGDNIVVTYTAPSGIPSTATLRFFESVTGSISLDASTYFGTSPTGSVSKARVTLTDADLNADPNAVDTHASLITVRTSADLNAIVSLKVNETGINTGIFTGEFFFTNGSAFNDPDGFNSRIPVSGGFGPEGPITTTLTVRYNDTVDVLGNLVNVTATAAWQEARTATLDFVSSDFRTVVTSNLYNGTDKAYFRVFDLDKDSTSAADTVSLSVNSTSGQPTPAVIITLTESGPHTGEFFGSIDLVSTVIAGKLRVNDANIGVGAAANETIWATYDDAFGTTGGDIDPITKNAGWNRATDGTVRLTRSDFNTDTADFYGNGSASSLLGRMFIRVDDVDRNTTDALTDTVTVFVSSSMDPTNTATATLTELAGSNGVFTGAATFSEGAKAANFLWVNDRSTVTVTYDDINGVGTPSPRTDTATWHAEDSGVPTTDLRVDNGGLSIRGIRSAANGVTITVIDQGVNVNRATAETLTVTATTPNVTSSSSMPITLTETHANSGVFRGTLGFTNGTQTSGLVRVPATNTSTPAENGTDVVLTYLDAFNAAGNPATVISNFTWNETTPGDWVQFSSATYSHGDTAAIFLVNETQQAAAGTTTQRCIWSNLDPAGYNLTFTQTDGFTGVYKATVQFLTSSGNNTNPPKITVSDVGSSTVSLNSTTCGGATLAPTEVTTNAVAAPTRVQFFLKDFTAAAPDEHKDFGTNRSAFIDVLDSDQNQDSDLRETISVAVGDETVALIETTATSGRFQRSLLYENTPASNNGAIGVASGGTVTLSFADTRHPSGSTTFTDTVVWYKAGSIVFQDTLGGTTATGYFGARNLFLEVTDPFQSKAAGTPPVGDVNTADHLFVTVQSRDSADSLLVDLTETGADTGVFRGFVELLPSAATPTATTLTVGSNALDRDDLINVTFQDNNTAVGGEQVVEHVIATIGWTRAETGILCLTKPPVLGNVFAGGVTDCSATQPAIPASTFPDLDRYHGLAGHQRQSYVFLNDAGLDTTTGADSADIRIFSTSDATGINVVARETAARSGLFLASFGFTTGGSSDTSDSLKVAEGDAISATYNDPKRTDGTTAAVLVANTVLWNQTATATLVADKQKYSGTDSPVVTLTDKDLDTTSGADQVLLPYVAGELNGTLLTITGNVTVTETGANTGIFRATGTQFENLTQAQCNAQSAKICVRAGGSTVHFIYNDTRDVDGRTPSFPLVNVTWRPVNSGYVLLDLDTYATFAATGTITVVDSGMNSDTIAVNTGFVRLLSNSDPTGEIITVTETGLNTGILTGPVAFESARTVGNGKVLVSDGDVVTALYYDEVDGTPSPDDAVDTDTARFQSSAPVAPTAIISAAPTSGAPPLAVTFTLSASDDGQITGWGLDINNDGTNEFTGTDNLKAGSVQKSHSYSDAGTFTAKLTVTDNNGITGSSTVTITVSAAVVPGAPIPTLTANTTTGPAPLFVNFTLGASDDGTIASWRFDANGDLTNDFTGTEDIEATPLSRLFTFATPGTYTATLNVTDNIGTQANKTLTIIVTNGTPPVPTLTTPTQTGVAPLQVNFTLAATDDGTIASWTFDANGDGTNEFTGTDNLKAASLIRSHNYTVAGTFVAKLTVTDNQANSVNTTVTITVTSTTTPAAVTAASIQAANQGIVVTVTRDGDDNIVSWTLPTNLPATPKGVQIWRALSPFTLLKTLLATDADYQDRSFRDVDAPATAKYIVTVFYGFTPAEGFFAGPGDPEGQIPGFAALGSGSSVSQAEPPSDDGGLSTLAWVLIILGIVVVLALIVLLVIMLTRKKDEEVVEEGQAGWSEPVVETAPVAAVVAGDVHTLRCPACSTEFQATGPKPLTTNCPNCGRRGILR